MSHVFQTSVVSHQVSCNQLLASQATVKPTILCLVPHVINSPPPTEVAPPKPTTPSSSHMFDSGAAPSEGPGPQCKHYFTKSLYLRQGLEQTKKYAKNCVLRAFFGGRGRGALFHFPSSILPINSVFLSYQTFLWIFSSLHFVIIFPPIHLQ